MDCSVASSLVATTRVVSPEFLVISVPVVSLSVYNFGVFCLYIFGPSRLNAPETTEGNFLSPCTFNISHEYSFFLIFIHLFLCDGCLPTYTPMHTQGSCKLGRVSDPLD